MKVGLKSERHYASNMQATDAEADFDDASFRRTTYDIVAQLIAQGVKGPPSRNQNFEDWQDKARGAAYRLYARLLDIQADLEKIKSDGHSPMAQRDGHGSVLLSYALEHDPQGRVTRRATLSAEEWDLLRALCGDLTPPVVNA